MKVFLSWSGPRSKAVAELLGDWLSCVLQACRPWISTRDIDRGALWFGEIHDQLRDTSVGIVVLTQENKIRPWIMFEAGALAKGLTQARVCTFLVDLAAKDVEDPLSHFNHTTPDKEGVKTLVLTLNNSLGDARLRDRVVSEVFETYWPQFESEFGKLLANTKAGKPAAPRPDGEVLAEILDNTRSLQNRVRELERSGIELTRDTSLEQAAKSAGFPSPREIATAIVLAMSNGYSLEEAKKKFIPHGTSWRSSVRILDLVRTMSPGSDDRKG